MRKYLAYYENEWPANIAELTAVENKPFVGYLNGEGVSYTVIPPKESSLLFAPNNEIWFFTTDNQIVKYSGTTYNRFEQQPVEPFTIIQESNKIIWRVESNLTFLPGDEFMGTGVICKFDPFEYIPQVVTNVVLPKCLKIIDYHFFAHCVNLNKIILPLSVAHICVCAFFNCSSLKDIYYEGTKEQWNSIQKDSDENWSWNKGCPEITVHCTDGDITIPATDQ